jgi:hypothetical protein
MLCEEDLMIGKEVMSKTQFVQITRRGKFAEDEFYGMINSMYEQIWQNLFPPQFLTHDLSNTIAGNVITPKDTPAPDCLTCGVCCASLLCVGVRPSEDEKLSPEDYWDITATTESGEEIIVDRYLRRNGETLACQALDGELGVRVGCRIYENRPRICHLFEAGSDRCHAIRRAYGIEPYLSPNEMLEGLEKLDTKPEPTGKAEVIQSAKIEQISGSQMRQITVLMKDNASRVIHTYNPEMETWRQFEFDALTLDEVRKLIKSRSQTVKS